MNGTRQSHTRISDVLADRATFQAQQIALHVLVDDHTTLTRTYAELDRQARAIAHRLAALAEPGARVLLLLPSGADYVAAFFGCLYAGMIAVPVFPPESQRARHLERLRAIAADARPSVLLGVDADRELLAPLAQHCGAHSVAVDTLPGAPAQWRPAAGDAEAIAFLQYTSGSTAAPKGVEVSHANLMANQAAIRQALAVTERDVFVSWLPLYHDMGLIGGLLQPVYSGVPLVLMSPQFFLERPARWLQAIGRFGGTVSGGPDFSYRLCLERIGEGALRALDLRSWRIAFSGAEPIRFDTLQRFADMFAPAGLRRAALYPSYGLAEATLFVTGRPLDRSYSALPVAAAELARHSVRRDEAGWPLVNCGVPVDRHRVAIADPHDHNWLPELCVGEIWASGPSIARGYWNNDAATRASFVERDGVRWLRTGDLGFLHAGELYVAGRLKDLIIVRGHNLYPQDIEQTVERDIELVRKGRVAAFAVEIDGAEGIGVAAEVSQRVRNLVAPEKLAEAISAAVAAAHQEAAALVVLLNPGALPKTSSGKLQRSACRNGWRDGSLDAFAVYRRGRLLQGAQAAPAQALTEREQALAALWSELLGVADIGPDDHFFVLGGNSLLAAQLCARVRERWRAALEPRSLFEAPTLRAFSEVLERAAAADALPAPAALPRQPFMPQSFAQSRLWFLAQLEPDSAAYNLALNLELRGPLQVAALQGALTALAARHETLRTTFHQHDGDAVQSIHAASDIALAQPDLSGVPEAERAERARALIDAAIAEPFDLQRGPLLRALLCRLREDDWRLCIVAHHIIADGWSMPIFIRELAQLYTAECEGREADLPALPIQYADYALWQRRRLESGAGAAQLAWWREQLGAEHPLLALPADRPRPPRQSHRGASLHFAFDAALADRVRAVARACEVTPFMVLLAAFKVFLYRVSGQSDIRVGVPVANRTHVATEGLIGFFVNTLVLRSRIDGRAHFSELLRQVRATVLGAQAHQDLPFEQLVEALQPERSLAHNPLFQVKFNYGFAVPPWPGDGALQVDGGIADQVGAHFDLALDIVERADRFDAVFNYATDLFDAVTVAGWRDHFTALLRALLQAPERRLADSATARDSIARGADRAFPAATVLTLQAHWAHLDADAPALQCASRVCRRGELERAANRVAALLRARGIGREQCVALCAPRSIEWVVGLLGVLKAGAACVPLDPDTPPQRLRHIAAECGAALTLSAGAALERAGALGAPVVALDGDALAGFAPDAVPVAIDPRQCAYVIYTSGSTGAPKGVAVSHGALANYAQGLLEQLRPAPATAMALVSSVAADLGHTVLFGALCSGGVLHLPDAQCAGDADRFADYMAEHAVAVLKIVPGHLRALLQAARADAVLPSQTLIVGGEVCDRSLLDTVRALRPGLRVINHYGPTETTVGALTAELDGVDAARVELPIGAPLPNTRALILDADLNPVPVNAPGELYLGGAGVARGYLARAALTAERFVPDPFERGERLYRSGDRARLRRDGAIEFLGRADDQVKIRGYRVEPEEAAAALRALAGVDDAAVIARRDADGGARLIGYCVAKGADAAQLRERLRAALPDHLLPAQIVLLERLPRTANGKLERAALPPVDVCERAREEPATDLERRLLALWREVLPDADIGVADNFFEVGGDSILSLKLIARARRQGLQLTPRQIFEAQTIRALAAQLQGAPGEPEARALPIARVERGGELALSHAQSRLWFLWQLEPDNSVYNVAGSLRLRGALDQAALAATFATLVQRHETLRTIFAERDGRVVQVIHPARPPLIDRIDLSALAPAGREAEARSRAAAEARTPFDLERGPLLRVQLLKLAPDDHLLLVTLHHIIADGWSMNILIAEFAAGYAAHRAGVAPALPPLPIQYVDYARWQRDWLAADGAAPQLAYWRGQLGDEQPALELPTDHVRPAALSYRGDSLAFSLPPALTTALRRAAQSRRVTLSTLLLTAFIALLHRCSGQRDVRVGVPVANRRWLETEGLIGFFVNMLVVRAQLDENADFGALLQQVAGAFAQAQQHQDLPFESLVETLNPERSLARNPLFQVTYNHRRRDYDPLRALAAAGLRAEEPVPTGLVTQFDLTLNTEEIGDELRNSFTYSTDLFERESIARLADQLVALLQSALAQPQRPLAMLALAAAPTPARAARIAPARNCLHTLFERQAAMTPDAVALSWPEAAQTRTLTYAALDARANALAPALRARGVGADALVGLCFERGPDLVVAMLAVLKAGGAYLPLDPDYPAARIRYMLEDARPHLLLTRAQLRARLPDTICAVGHLDDEGRRFETDCDRERADVVAAPVGVHNIAYCIYTSGSTGRPKGVLISHAAIVNHMLWMRRRFGAGTDTVVLQKTPFSFDASVWEFWLPLLCGGRCALAPPQAARDPALLWRSVAEQRITHLQVVPSLLEALLEQDSCDAGLRALRYLFCGGEALPATLAQRVLRRWPGEMWNLYGPTETSIDASAWRCAEPIAGAAAPIGAPIANTDLHVLDAALDPLPVGVLGELYIGGAGLARGYLRRARLTAERFVPDPFRGGGARLYRSGDLARRRADGAVDYAGRVDQQVKLRGYRIEPEEIAERLRACEAVRAACVLAREDAPGDRRLVGYVLADGARLKADHRAQQQRSGAMIEQWQAVFDATYAAAGSGPSFTGWNSSYDDAPIAHAQMQDWLDGTLARIRALRPRRLLEIGCGVGLLLQHLAPDCDAYRGTDLSAQALGALRAWMQARPELAHVELAQCEAADFEGLPPHSFDTVVLNSVVQYFPDADYLRAVCAGALRVIGDNGALFIGDVRHLGLLRAFHTSVQLAKAPAQLPLRELRRRIDRALAQDKELVLDPEFFRQLGAGAVEIALKRSVHDNELTRYRYDVVLRAGGGRCAMREMAWAAGDGSARCAALLAQQRPPALRLRGVPNRRVARDVAACELLEQWPGQRSAEELRAALARADSVGEDPETFWALGIGHGYDVRVSWAADSREGRFDVVFIDRARADFDAAPLPPPAPEDRRLATDPLLAQLAQQFGAQLRERLRAELPDYLVPAHIAVLEQWPLTPSGKLDRNALPAPDIAAAQKAHVEPRSAQERALAGIWQQLLRIERVGAEDNFFELGGHSLLATQLVSRLRAQCGVSLPLRAVFEHPTLAQQAAAIEALANTAPADTADRFEALFDELETP